MIHQPAAYEYDPAIHISDAALVQKLAEAALIGKWFVFLRQDWLARSGMDTLLSLAGIEGAQPKAAILFRGQKELTLPGATVEPTPLPQAELLSLTSDKMLYRANKDMVRLLIAAPQKPGATLKLRLTLNGSTYADYPLTLDRFGLYLWAMQGLPEGAYEAWLHDTAMPVCRFEVAEYRLAPLQAELRDQQLSGQALRYTLRVTSFGQPYSGPIEVELQEGRQRIGKREKLTCNREGVCRGVAKLSGTGPFTLNLFVGERTARVALKGSEQERREALVISELGELRVVSLLPMPQSNYARGFYITRGGNNNEPFLVRRVVGSEVEITARREVELLRVVVVNPATGECSEQLFEGLQAEQSVRLPISSPYGIVLLGAFLDDKAWEGWCAVLRPSDLQLQCDAPKEARPGSRISIKLKTNAAERVVPVHLLIKDQRLIAASDPLVELAACMKKNLEAWKAQSQTGVVERQLAQVAPYMMRARLMAATPFMATAAPTAAIRSPQALQSAPLPRMLNGGQGAPAENTSETSSENLSRVRLQFLEVVYNDIVEVRGEHEIEVQLGESMTRYSVEAFALSPETLDWQRVETSIEATQPVYGELTVSPFVFPGDPVMGRLDVGAASGSVIAEVRHDNEILPLFSADGSEVTPGLPLPSGSTLYFPLRPGTITAIVRDGRKGSVDVSERYVTEPGKLRHIARHVKLLLPGDEVTLQEPGRLALRLLPGLERPFAFFVEGAVHYPFGCVEQTSMKLLAMLAGYIVFVEKPEVAREYEAALPVWHQRLKKMYLPDGGFCLYPPDEGGERKADTHYAPLAVERLLSLPSAEQAGITQPALKDMLADVKAMAQNAARYYKIEIPPRKIVDCQDAYQTMTLSNDARARREALMFARERLREHGEQTYVDVSEKQTAYQLFGQMVSRRTETAFAAATLLVAGDTADLPQALAATNYLAGQLNEQGRLYSTVDTAACLALLLALRSAGVVAVGEKGSVELNGQALTLAEALNSSEKLEKVRCIEGVIAVEITSEVIESWSAYKGQIPLEVYLEHDGKAGDHFRAGDALELVLRVPRYQPGLVAHVCLPDALSRIVGGGQVKQFSLDFSGRNELRIPLAATGTTILPERLQTGKTVQHWAVIARNMFKEEQVGNPGLLTVMVE